MYIIQMGQLLPWLTVGQTVKILHTVSDSIIRVENRKSEKIALAHVQQDFPERKLAWVCLDSVPQL